MRAKIVRFNDGSYGVRRWTLFGYKFLGRDADYWWFGQDSTRKYAHMPLYRAQELLDYGATPKDKGVPI